MWQLIRDHSDNNQKRQLLEWIQTKLPSLKITNLTTDWNDGKVIGALVDAMAQG